MQLQSLSVWGQKERKGQNLRRQHVSVGNSTFKEIVFSLSSKGCRVSLSRAALGCWVAQDIDVLITLPLDRGVKRRLQLKGC